MLYYVRTTLERSLSETYNQIPYQLIIDREHLPIDSFINALYLINDEDSVLLEDDLVLCENFEHYLGIALQQYPDRVINFFYFPLFYFPIKETYQIAFNQCTFYPKGIAKQISDIMVKLPRNDGIKKNMYSLLERDALTQLGIKVVQYRPCIVQHLDTDTLLFDKTDKQRRTPYFIDYLNELGITYEEAGEEENRAKLVHSMHKHFEKLCKQRQI